MIVVRQPENPKTEMYHNVHIVGPEAGPNFSQMFARAACSKSETGLQGADLVIFTGGSTDIHPMLYGADPNTAHDSVWFESQTCIDTMLEYIDVFQECYYRGIPMIGVCLGAQFLHVMNGGKLYQDVDNHNSDHQLYCSRTKDVILESSSVHHQMCIENEGMTILATAYESNERWLDREKCELVIDKPDVEDIEAFWYEETICLGVQGHPEYMGYPKYTKWFFEQIEHYIIHNPRLAYESSMIRLKSKHRAERDFKLPETVQNFIKEYR